MANFFDEFDSGGQSSNFFDSFDEPVQSQPSPEQNTSLIGDLGTDLKRGVQQLPGVVTGLADVGVGALTGRRVVDETADKIGEATGFQPSKWQEEARQEYSPARQAGTAEIEQAWEDGDALDVAGAYARNPGNVAGLVAESLPQMLAGGAIGRGALVGGRAAGLIAAPATAAQAARQAVVAGAGGEGAVIAGGTMDQIDREVDPRRAALASAGAGVAGAALSGFGARLAQRAGLIDVESALAGGVGQVAGQSPGLARRVAGGALTEGVLEELPQSVQEQMLQNWAEQKPLMEGVPRAAVEGTLAGSAIGGAVNVARRPSEQMGLDPAAGPLSAAAATAVDGAPTGSQTPVQDAVRQSMLSGAPDTQPGGRYEPISQQLAIAQELFPADLDESGNLRFYRYDQNLQSMVEVPEAEALAAAQRQLDTWAQQGFDPQDTRGLDELVPQVEELPAQPPLATVESDTGPQPVEQIEQPLPLPTVESDTGPMAVEDVQARPVAGDPNFEIRVQKNGRPFRGERDVRLLGLFNQLQREGESPIIVPHEGGWAVAVPREPVPPPAPLGLPAPSTMVVDSQGNAQRGVTAPFVEPGAQVRPIGGPGMERQAPAARQPVTDVSRDNSRDSGVTFARDLQGDDLGSGWVGFNQQSGSLGVPRADMPQIRADHRGAMVNFMNARGVTHEEQTVPARSLRPTQAEFSPERVGRAAAREGTERSILVSGDGYVLDGHHQWLAQREAGGDVKVIRLNAPMAELLPLAREFPSSFTDQASQEVQGADSRPGPVNDRAAGDTPAVPDAADNVAREPVVAERPAAAGRSAEAGGAGVSAAAPATDGQPALSEQPAADQSATSEENAPVQADDQAPALPEILATPRKRYIDRQAKAAGIKKGSPGYDQAIQRLQDQYEADVDRASAGITFEQYNELNSDSPEGVNRQAWEALRQEFGQQQYSRNSYRRAPEQGQGARAGQLRMQIKRLTGAWQNAPDVKVVQSIKDLPDRQRRQVERDGAFDVEGIFADGQVYLVADNLRDAKHAAFVLQHEVLGHAGLQGAYGQRLTPLLMSIYNGNPEMKSQADALVRRFGYKPAVAMEEVLADMAGAGTIQQQDFWPRLVTAMRNALRSIGFNMRWTEGDIQGLLANARAYIENGRRRAGAREAFSRDGRSGMGAEIVDEQGRLLAPNGKPSKLTQKQWHQARGENFKRWFGDWQAVAAEARLANLSPVRIRVPDGWRNLSIKELRAKAKQALDAIVKSRVPLMNDDIGEVSISRNKGVNKFISEGADPAKLLMAEDLRSAFKRAVYSSSRAPKDPSAEPNVAAFEKLLAKVSVADTELVAIFTVQRLKDGSAQFYNAMLVDPEIREGREETPAVSPRDTPIAGERATSAHTGVTDFVRRPLERVNPGDVSKLTDGNGEPLVIYHGSPNEFSVFDQARAGESTGHSIAPLGIFLTADQQHARGHAENVSGGSPGSASVMPLFASIKNPYRMSVAESQAIDTPQAAIEMRQKLEREGYDGIQLGDTGTWVAFYNNQVKSATNNTGAFDGVDPDIRYSRASQRDTEALRKLGLAGSEAQNLVDQVRNVTLGGLQAKLKEWSVRSEEGIFDGLAGIRRAEEAVGVTDANQQGYVSARLASGIADVMHGVLHYAAPEWRDGIVSGKAGTRGVLEILGDLGADNLTPWLAWLGGKRAQLLKAQGRENNLTDTEIAELVAMGQGKEELFEKVYREYAQVNDAVLDLAQEAGLIDQDARAKWLTDYYVPFYRQDESEGIFTAPRSKRGLSHQTAAIKALKGGNLPTNDLLANMLAGWTKRIDAAMKNKALLEVVDNLQGSDYLTDESPRWQQVLISRDQIAQQIRKDRKALALAADLLDLPAGSNVIKVVNQLMKPESEGFEKLWTRVAPTDPDIIRLQRDGKSEYYRVNDESLLRGLKFMEGSVFNDPITKIGRTFKRILTTGVTASPDFILRNFIRDAAHAWVINKDRFTLGKDSLKGMRDALREDQDYRDLMFAGGSFQGGYVHGADPEASAQIIRRALEKKGFTRKQQEAYLGSLVNTPAKAAAMLGKGWQKYRELGDKVENANRLSTYKAAIEAGKSRRQASYEAKDLMDYSLRGNFAAAQWFTDVVPFLNARLQGLYKLGRAVKGDKTLLAKEVAMKGGYIALFSLMLAGLNDDDERYQALMDWDKDMHWHIFLGDEHFRIPKPFELGLIFGTVPERILHALTGTQDGGDLAKAVSRGVFDTLAFNPVPQFYQPIRELQANRNFFRDSPIEDMSDEGKLPEARYDERTSAIGRALGQVTGPIAGLSPKQVDHLIAAYTGTLGQYVLDMSSLVANSMSDAERPASRSGDIPILKVLYQGDSPRSTKYQSEFYDMMREADQLNRTIKAYREEGRVDAAEQLMAANREKLRHRPALGFARKQLGNVRNQMDAVYRDAKMTPEQKRQRLDALQRQSNQIAERIVKLAGGDF
ncbi:LPD38 domain-containing protein [Pseudomonas sp. UBA7530]|uniref:LPD38 domain-containing protein n=1 Tax=Pseudomonas sp. UBA7530 TaxID=1947341 RepID=UPI0025D7741D|nr:LPD38 domain-containing protein [Pseudomonas sp. UBA7530]